MPAATTNSYEERKLLELNESEQTSVWPLFETDPSEAGRGYYEIRIKSPPIAVFDTTIPEGVGYLLQMVGGGLIIANTTIILLLSLLTVIRKRKTERKKRVQTFHYLDTEAGVSAILMESKHYALAQRRNKNTEGI